MLPSSSTDRHATPKQILHRVVMRWAVEVTFEEAPAHLGVETQRQWTDKAISRTTPVLLGLFSLVTLLARRLCPTGRIPVAGSAWYHQPKATFTDCLVVVRQHMWRTRNLVNSAPQADLVRLPQEVFDLLLSDLPIAA